jgi:putative transposase
VLDEVARLAAGAGIGLAERTFVKAAKAGTLDPALREVLRIANARRGANGRTIHRASLWTWRRLAAGSATPVERIVRLAPGTRGKKWTLTNDVAAALARYRQPNKPTLNWCVRETATALQVPVGSLYSRCRRELKKLPKQLFYVGRNSGAALKALQPFRRREFHSLLPNDIWIGDGHGAKLKIAHPETGRPFVPEVTVVMDVQARYLVGWSVSLSENCLAVSDALRHGISRHGVPLIYYSDGGAGQTAKMLDAPLTGILPAMGIQHETGRPGNPQGRGVIERFWQTVLIPLAKRFATYQGHNADRETLRKVSNEIDRQLRAAQRGDLAVLPARLPSFAQFIEALEDEIERYNTAHHHRSLPKVNGAEHATPAQYRAARAAGVDIHIPDSAELAALFTPSVLRTAARGEVKLWNGVYFSRDLALVDGEQVRVHYDIHDASRVWVKKLSGELIACAEAGANSSAYMPKPVIEQLREQRASRRMQRLESKMEDVRVEFSGTTFTRPEREVPPDTPEEAAERVALAREMADGNVVQIEDDQMRFSRRQRLQERLAAGESIEDRDAEWLSSYEGSSEFRSMKSFYDDFGLPTRNVTDKEA